MATARTTLVNRLATQRDIDVSQELQNQDIKQEFQNVHQKLDEQRTYIDLKLDEQRTYIDGRFQQVDDRFQQVDDRLSDLEVLIKNSRATNSWHDILPVRVQNSIPPNFPNKVIKFWRLQRSRHHSQLIDLLRFYRVRASDLTTSTLEDNDDTESESTSESLLTLEEAVKADPAFALAHLAACLGLDYDSIHHNMGLKQIQETKTLYTKRDQSTENKDDTQPSKKKTKAAQSGSPLAAALAGSSSSSSTKSTIPFSTTPSAVGRAIRYGALAPAEAP